MSAHGRRYDALRTIVLSTLVLMCGAPCWAQDDTAPETAAKDSAGAKRWTSTLLRRPQLHDVSAPLRLMRPVQRVTIKRVMDAEAVITPDAGTPAQAEDEAASVDAAATADLGIAPPAAPTALSTFEGIGRGLAGYTVAVAPPDTEGAVGKDYFVQVVNSHLAVFSKATGAVVFGPVPLVTLWQGFPTSDGNRCAKNNDGDPIVYYDQLADRWFVSQFDVTLPAGATSDYQCVAVSTSSDPLGSWYRWSYQIPANLMGDYEKIGLWPDGYYMTIRGFRISDGLFQGSRLLVFDRAKLLVGAPDATQLDSGYLGTTQDGFTPMSLDGFTPPRAGTPGAVAKWVAGAIRFYFATVNSNPDGSWAASPTLTMSGPHNVAVTAFTQPGVSFFLPQPGTTTRLDTLSNNLMYRLAYRNFGTPAAPDERLVVNHTVRRSATQSSVRWYLFRSTTAGSPLGPTNLPTVVQQETWQPTSASRWMGSIAMDKRQNIGIGYNIVDSTTATHAGIAFSGRLATDPTTPTILQGETVAQAGSDFQTLDGTNTNSDLGRWGDYSQISVDPIDDCTFWYTSEYLANDGAGDTHAFDWHTAFTSFRHPDCLACTAPTTPTGVRVTANSATSYTLSWAAAPSAGSYNVFRSLAACPGGTPVKLATCPGAAGCAGNNLSYTDTSALPGTTYYYAVSAIDSATSNCESIRSTCVSSATGSCVQRPSFAGVSGVSPYVVLPGGVVANNTCNLHLSWSAGASNCPDNPGVSYNVYRSTTSPFTPAPGNRIAKCVAGTSYDDTSVAGATTYYYTVRAEDTSAGNGGVCNGGNEDVNTVRQSSSPGNYTSLFYQNFDATTAGAVPTGWAQAGNWAGARACAPTYSGGNILRWGNAACAGNYPQGAGTAVVNDDLTSPTISIPAGSTGTRLSIIHRWNFAGSVFDGAKVRISVNGAAPIEVPAAAFLSGGYTANRGTTDGCATTYQNTGIWGGQQNTFVNSLIDLEQVCTGGCAGKTVRLFLTGISNCTATVDKGWYVDDVQVLASTSATCGTAPSPLQVLAVTSRNGQNVLQWLSPAAGTGLTLDIRYRTDAYPSGPNDGTSALGGPIAITAGARGTATHTATNGTTHYYAAYVFGAGLPSTSVLAKGKPFAPAAAGAQWTYGTGAASLSPPGGSVVVVSNDRLVHRVTSGAGAGVWPAAWTPLRLNNPVQNRPTVVPASIAGATNVMFLGAQDGKVHAVNADTGALLWSSALLGDMVQAGVSGTLTQYGSTYNVLMAGTRNSSAANAFVGLNPNTGATLWTYTHPSGMGIVNGTAAVGANNKIYFASRARSGGSNGTVWCLDFTASTAALCNGGVGWPVARGDIDGSPVLANGTLYVGTNTGVVYGLNPTTGATIWSNALGDGPIKGYLFPVYFSSPNVFYVATTSKVHRLSYTSGTSATVSWSFNVPGPSIPFYNSNTGYLYVGSSDGKLHQLGNLAAAAPTDTLLTLGAATAAVGSPSVDGSGFLNVGTDDGTIYSVVAPY
jgi:outer membrane protein assembly factor BamB